ncbi:MULTISPECIES: GntR family transcriptional regulator [Acinetobacter]|jgi:DNA-binding GntR family transcriptional regulator|uniref:GntR family transcriptional regulator n=1 Tax=Acinetobacter TaxID=469 RepID=UPI00132BD185|nr:MULTISPECIES: GntR family transcriptional regulator [Acinetobacter]MBK5646327.1 GntR family transcriptional regulator [Acinetobacter sp.]MWC18373.1 FCD domain-containing protein [Acinetobacter johnsonii]NWK57953.1 GntR family transcriptional regulator [Acinetobacter sp. SwsAc2]HRA29675.1 GntR family transcriptional regulator [Acinetobacter johnsonii]HRB84502.1 GntR family transcriptional regulator [Acinetobacter johnsonii]
MKLIQKPKTLTEEAFEILQDAIINNHLQFNVLYSATELGQMLGGISRTPVREAAQMLEKIGIVKIEKNKGIRIIPTTFTTMIESFQIRLMLEVPLVYRATKVRTEQDIEHLNAIFEEFKLKAASNDITGTLKADRDYHLALLQIVGNQKAIDIISNTRNQVLIAGSATIPHSRNCMQTFDDHLKLHHAFVSGDAQQAANLMKDHIINTATLLINQESEKRENWSDYSTNDYLNWI